MRRTDAADRRTLHRDGDGRGRGHRDGRKLPRERGGAAPVSSRHARFPGCGACDGRCRDVRHGRLFRDSGRSGTGAAWRSSAGSVEHYTFPIVRTTTVRTERREAEGPQGRVVAAAETDREIVLVSAYETRSMLEPLAELTATAAAWIVTEKRYIPVDIATEEAVVQRRGTLSCLEIAIRPKRKKHAAWN